MHDSLIEKIEARDAQVAIIGLGYVGLPLAIEFAGSGLKTVGIDVDGDRVNQVNGSRSYVMDVGDDELGRVVDSGHLRATTDYSALQTADCVCICVPTPLGKTRNPDISCIVAACDEIVRYFHPGMLVVLESTTYPGTTEELILPRLHARDGRVAIEGWTEGTSVASADLMRGMMDAGVRRFLYTDISRDGTLGEPNFQVLGDLLGVIDCPIQASGGVSREEHLVRLASMGAEGAIVGRALYTGDLDLRAAVKAAGNR